jgi:hypothetical protein
MAPEASPVEDVSAYPTLAEWLAAAPFTLAMASSYFGFFAHAGMLQVRRAFALLARLCAQASPQALAEAGLRPAKVCGSSSGSIIAALYSGGLDPQTTLPDLLLSLKPTDSALAVQCPHSLSFSLPLPLALSPDALLEGHRGARRGRVQDQREVPGTDNTRIALGEGRLPGGA